MRVHSTRAKVSSRGRNNALYCPRRYLYVRLLSLFLRKNNRGIKAHNMATARRSRSAVVVAIGERESGKRMENSVKALCHASEPKKIRYSTLSCVKLELKRINRSRGYSAYGSLQSRPIKNRSNARTMARRFRSSVTLRRKGTGFD